MDIGQFAVELEAIIQESQVVYLHIDPLITDFTKKSSATICIHGPSSSACFSLADDYQRLNSIMSLLGRRILSKGFTVITWDIKKFVSYLKSHLRYVKCKIESSIIDLKYSESFCGVNATQPHNFQEAVQRTKAFAQNMYWQAVYRNVHLPLAIKVLPHMEIKGVIDQSAKKVLYTSYDIEGQVNGRMSCQSPGSNYLNPHTLSAEVRQNLRPRGETEKLFIELDFQHMEVNVLQWLTGDPTLKRLIDSKNDVYAGIHELILDKPCETPEQRSFIKQIFLPVMFGLRANSLSSKLSIEIAEAERIFSAIQLHFFEAVNWMEEKELELIENPIATDWFGRKRDFANVSPHKRRNFEIQAPASVVCLEQLVHLHDAMSEHLLFHIHDAYVLTCPVNQFRSVAKKAKEILETPTILAPDLKLSVGCKVGFKLSAMKRYLP